METHNKQVRHFSVFGGMLGLALILAPYLFTGWNWNGRNVIIASAGGILLVLLSFRRIKPRDDAP
jgi:hypothetical protein